MNKTDLVNEVAERTEMSKKDSTKVVDAVITSITETLGGQKPVKITGFGNFEVRERAARKGRNPQTGEEINIPASRTVGFKPAKALKEIVKQS